MIHIASSHLRKPLSLFVSVACLLLVACNKQPAIVDHPRLTSAVTMQDVTFFSASASSGLF